MIVCSYQINTHFVMHVPANFCTVINNYYPVFRQIEMEQRVLIPGVIRKLDEVCFRCKREFKTVICI
jgi:hypothetical protein